MKKKAIYLKINGLFSKFEGFFKILHVFSGQLHCFKSWFLRDNLTLHYKIVFIQP